MVWGLVHIFEVLEILNYEDLAFAYLFFVLQSDNTTALTSVICSLLVWDDIPPNLCISCLAALTRQWKCNLYSDSDNSMDI